MKRRTFVVGRRTAGWSVVWFVRDDVEVEAPIPGPWSMVLHLGGAPEESAGARPEERPRPGRRRRA